MDRPIARWAMELGQDLVSATVLSTRECKLCSFPAHPFASVDFNKACNSAPLERSGVLVEYFRCQRCELLFTDFFDRWTKDKFLTFVYNDEYGLVDPEYLEDRPKHAAAEMAPMLRDAEGARILDYGSGSGIFEQEMRARGFAKIESFDPFSRPDPPNGTFDIITCFDAIEHSPWPRQTFADIMGLLRPDGCLLVGQTLQPPNITSLRGDWWYLAPRNGHCTTFSPETLLLYAEENDVRFFDFGDLFAFTGMTPSAMTSEIIARRQPQVRKLTLAAPAKADGAHGAWHDAEPSPSGLFRWTREPDVCLGIHRTPKGSFRVVLRCLGSRSPEFLRQCQVRVGIHAATVSVHEDDLFAVLDLPEPAWREISLITPQPMSDAALGLGTDLRPVGLAICCAD